MEFVGQRVEYISLSGPTYLWHVSRPHSLERSKFPSLLNSGASKPDATVSERGDVDLVNSEVLEKTSAIQEKRISTLLLSGACSLGQGGIVK